MGAVVKTGAQALLRTLADQGVRVRFVNPDTGEMHLVAVLDGIAEIRPVLCLFEGVVSGAAYGYGRIVAGPAMTLLDLGSGLSNAAANLPNAGRTHTPIPNCVGDHSRDYRALDHPLISGISSIARACSCRIDEVASVGDAAAAVQRASGAAVGSHRGPATLVLPADCAWLTAGAINACELLPKTKVISVDIAAIAAGIHCSAKPAPSPRRPAPRRRIGMNVMTHRTPSPTSIITIGFKIQDWGH